MMNIQKKSLQYVSKKLSEIDNYQPYREVLKVLDELNLPNEQRTAITNALQSAISVEFKKAAEAKEWIDVVISDLS